MTSRCKPWWMRWPGTGRAGCGCRRRRRGLRVTGLFPLDDGDRALEALRNTLPIRVQRLSGWYVMIDLA